MSGNTAKLARLSLHIGEVSLEVGPSMGIGGRNRDNSVLVDYLEILTTRRKELEALAGDTGLTADSPRVRSGFTYGRPL